MLLLGFLIVSAAALCCSAQGKMCDRPEILYGKLTWGTYYGFPKRLSSVIEYSCDNGYLPPDKEYYSRSTCTESGWIPRPQCLRTCSNYDVRVENAWLLATQNVYVSGDKVRFRCYPDYKTEDGNEKGERECLPTGAFTAARCRYRKTCTITALDHGSYQPQKKSFYVGENLQYNCNDGFVSPNQNRVENLQCTSNGWQHTPKCTEIRCPILERSKLISTKQEYKEGDVVQLSCQDGYRLSGSEYSQCHYNGWYPPLPTCEERNCNLPKITVVSDVKRTPYRLTYKVDDEAVFSCYKGYKLTGESRSRCSEHGWDPPIPSCTEITCTVTDTDILTRGNKREVKYDETLDARCAGRNGYRNYLCTESGWRPSLPTCSKNCTITSLDHGRYQPKKSSFSVGEYLRYQCDEGFVSPRRSRGEHIQCLTDGWQHTPQCTDISCTIPEGGNLISTKKEYKEGERVQLSCPVGYSLSGSPHSQCHYYGWDPSLSTCEGNPCGKPPVVEFANILGEKSNYKHNDLVEYKCLSGYKRERPSTAICLKGEWHDLPVCVSTKCDTPKPIPNGKIKNEVKAEYQSGEKVQYECNSGFALAKKRDEAVCENTQWVQTPVCRQIGERCGPPPLIEYGEIRQNRNKTYESGSTVEYLCPNYYIMEGNAIIECENGVWDDPPVCLEPCITSEKAMKEHNIRLKGSSDTKIYSEHGDFVSFSCLDGYEIYYEQALTVLCIRGVMRYPTCSKREEKSV